ncbi:MAG: glycosyltransferase [Burkholderiaceae bacterium]
MNAARSDVDLDIILPVYRNGATLTEMITRIDRSMDEAGLSYRVIFVVDASPDDSWERVRTLARQYPQVTGILHASNQGQHRAILTGLRHSTARWAAFLDADLQDPPEQLPLLMTTGQGEQCTVFALRQGRYQSGGRMISSRVFKRLLGWLIDLPATAGTYVLLPHATAVRMCEAPVRHPQAVVLARLCSDQWTGVPFDRLVRPAGESAYTSRARWRAAWRSLRCVFEFRSSVQREPSPAPARPGNSPRSLTGDAVIAASVNL